MTEREYVFCKRCTDPNELMKYNQIHRGESCYFSETENWGCGHWMHEACYADWRQKLNENDMPEIIRKRLRDSADTYKLIIY